MKNNKTAPDDLLYSMGYGVRCSDCAMYCYNGDESVIVGHEVYCGHCKLLEKYLISLVLHHVFQGVTSLLTDKD